MYKSMYKNVEQAQLIQILYQDGKRKRSKWVWKGVHCWGMDGRSFSHKGCSTDQYFSRNSDYSDVCIYIYRKDVSKLGKVWLTAHIWWLMTSNVNSMSVQNVIRLAARAVCRQLHREGYYSRAAMHKALITKMNAHLRVHWCRNHRHWSTEMWKKVTWSDESSFTMFSANRWVYVWQTPREQ